MAIVSASASATLTLETSRPPLLGSYDVALSLPQPDSRKRRVHTPEGVTAYVVLDGEVVGQTDQGHLDLAADRDARGSIKVYDGRPQDGYSPYDHVRLDWTGDAPTYRVERSPSGGTYETVADVSEPPYVDGPLTDGTYDYRVTAVDEEGDEAQSAERTVTVSSAPEPPSGLSWEWDDAAGELTLTWNASPSGDIDVYRVRGSGGAATLDPTSSPIQEDGTTSYVESFSSETGTYIYSVRAVDTDGNEEKNVRQMVQIPFEGGSPAGTPARPSFEEAVPVSGGKIEVSWHYVPAQEYLGPGQAEEARIYWNGGSGDIDYSSPHATVSIGGPEHPQQYSWTSAQLTDGTEYAFVVRIATATHPDGSETQNTNRVAAVPDSGVPETPQLDADLV